jgi:hypothetical protein
MIMLVVLGVTKGLGASRCLFPMMSFMRFFCFFNVGFNIFVIIHNYLFQT